MNINKEMFGKVKNAVAHHDKHMLRRLSKLISRYECVIQSGDARDELVITNCYDVHITHLMPPETKIHITLDVDTRIVSYYSFTAGTWSVK